MCQIASSEGSGHSASFGFNNEIKVNHMAGGLEFSTLPNSSERSKYSKARGFLRTCPKCQIQPNRTVSLSGFTRSLAPTAQLFRCIIPNPTKHQHCDHRPRQYSVEMPPKKKVERPAQENISLGPQVREGRSIEIISPFPPPCFVLHYTA